MNKLFYYFLVTTAIFVGDILTIQNAKAQDLSSATTQEHSELEQQGLTPPKLDEEQHPFLKDSKISGAISYFQRYRSRYDVEAGKYKPNLNHASGNLNMDFLSGYINDFIGIDFGIFGTADLYSDASPDHEMNFFPWNNPWDAKWSKTHARNGFSIYKANIKLKAGPVWGKIGYFQPTGPGVLGLNWSFVPGTYQGAELGANLDKLEIAAAWANEYKAPWYKDTYNFKQNDGEKNVDYLWSLGARYKFSDNFNLELAYGESENYLQNAHIKAKYNLEKNQHKFYATWQIYAMGDSDDKFDSKNNNFNGTAMQHYLALSYGFEAWTFKLEGLYTSAPNKVEENIGYFAYRLTSKTGSSKGAYEAWWDLLSDWNHDQEKAVFVNISRDFRDFDLPGFSAGASYAYGWDGKAHGYETKLQEEAYGFDLGYTVQEGKMKNSSAKLHYTRYDNKTNLPSWDGFKNAFQDSHDVKFIVTIPFSIK